MPRAPLATPVVGVQTQHLDFDLGDTLRATGRAEPVDERLAHLALLGMRTGDANAQQRNGALAALSLRQYSAAVALFQRISKFIVQTVASRSVTQSSGLTMSRAAGTSAPAAGRQPTTQAGDEQAE